MTVSKSPRLGQTRWSSDSDPVTRQQFDDDAQAIEERALVGAYDMPHNPAAPDKAIIYNEDDGTASYKLGTYVVDLNARTIGHGWTLESQASWTTGNWFRPSFGYQAADPALKPQVPIPWWFRYRDGYPSDFGHQSWAGSYTLTLELLLPPVSGAVGVRVDLGLGTKHDGTWPMTPDRIVATGIVPNASVAAENLPVTISYTTVYDVDRGDEYTTPSTWPFAYGFSLAPFVRISNDGGKLLDVVANMSYRYSLTRG